jgi:hypothetical protein
MPNNGRPAHGLRMWVVYERPSDFPDHYVVRMHWVHSRGGGAAMIGGLYVSLEEARADVPPGCVRFGRDACADPVILETWL